MDGWMDGEKAVQRPLDSAPAEKEGRPRTGEDRNPTRPKKPYWYALAVGNRA